MIKNGNRREMKDGGVLWLIKWKGREGGTNVLIRMVHKINKPIYLNIIYLLWMVHNIIKPYLSRVDISIINGS